MQVKRSYKQSSGKAVQPESDVPIPNNGDLEFPFDQLGLVKLARQIGDRIIDQAPLLADGMKGCRVTDPIPLKGDQCIRRTPLFFYSGGAGVALFFGALYRITGDEKYLKTARNILQYIIGMIRQLPLRGQKVTYYPLGIGAGFSSLVYVFIKFALLIGDPSWIGQAQWISEFLSKNSIEEDTVYDVLCGSAGALLAFLALYDVTSDPIYLKKAMYCGDHLVKGKVTLGSGRCGWKTLDDRPLSGFSHGAAGIACSLLRLFEQTGDERYYQTAMEAILYEDSLFSEEHRNWLDLRDLSDDDEGNKLHFMTSWCHGAPGIVMGRLSTLHLTDASRIVMDIENGLETTLSYRLEARDHLCCGNMGRIEVVLYSGIKLHRPDLLKVAGVKAAQVITKMEETGHFGVLHDPGVNVFHMGFFQGLSGIGYGLLRLAYPEALPSVLAFE